MANYIKVTLKGEEKGRIVLATLKDFYISQGAKVEKPTPEEVYAAVPQERPVGTPRPQAGNPAEVKALRAEVSAAEKANAEKDETIAKQAEEIENLKGQLAAAEATITESEHVIESLRNELDKKTSKAKKATGEADAEPET